MADTPFGVGPYDPFAKAAAATSIIPSIYINAQEYADIPAAIAAAVSFGITEIILPGNYEIHSQIKLGNVAGSLCRTPLIFRGLGQGATNIFSTVTGAPTWLIQNPDAEASFVWRDMTMVGPGGVYAPGANGAFSVTNAISLFVERCELSSWADTAIACNGGYNCHFERNYIHDVGNEGILLNGNTGKSNHVLANTFVNIDHYAIDINDNGSEVRGNGCYNIGTTGTTSAITIEGDFGQNPSDVIVAENIIVAGLLAAGINISCDGAAGSSVKRVNVLGNIIDGGGNCGYGIYITPQGVLSTISDIAMVANQVKGVNAVAIYATGGDHLLVSGNRLDAGVYAIRFDAGVTESIVGHNPSTAPNLIAPSTLALDLTSGGSTAKRALGVVLANGLNSSIALPNTSCLRVVGPTAPFSVGGFTGGSDGRELIVINTMPQPQTIVNEDAGSAAAERITTLTGANVVLRAGTSSFTIIYDSTNSRWILVSTN